SGRPGADPGPLRTASPAMKRARSAVHAGMSRGPDLPVAEAADEMVVDHPGRLHERVADGRADEGESAAAEIADERVGDRRARGDLAERAEPVDHRPSSDVRPHVAVEAAEPVLHAQERLRIPYRTGHFQPVADDVRVLP